MSFPEWTMLASLAVVVSVVSCSKEGPAARDTSIGGTPVQVTSPVIRDITEYVDLNANTVFLKKEIVRVTFQGFIERIYKNIGDEVRSGDLIFTVKTKESALDDSIRIDLGSEMFQGTVKIRAHSDGVLAVLNYHSGDFVSEGEEIAIISNPSSLYITLNVPYQYVSRIDPKSICQVYLPDGEIRQAVIQRIIPSVDPVSQTQTFLLRPEILSTLPENLNVDVRLPLQTFKDAVILPRRAVMSNETQSRFWVMRLIDDSTAVRVDVQKGIENDSLIQIVMPDLRPADWIISDGAYGLPDTARVTIIQ
jgi:multidrug efflux pump subunit AcrA (membrane-fusion protein)